MSRSRRVSKPTPSGAVMQKQHACVVAALDGLGDLYVRLVGLARELRDDTPPAYKQHVRRTMRGYRRILAQRSVVMMQVLSDLDG